MKKLISVAAVCLAAAILLPMILSAAARGGGLPFSDVKEEQWYYGNVKFVYENGIMKGTSGTAFTPDGALTRGMCVTILYRVAGSPDATDPAKFTDVDPAAYYAPAVAWAAENGVVFGRNETEFVPGGTLTRAEFAAMVYRYLTTSELTMAETNTSSPTDADKIPSYARDAVCAMYRAGIINGKSGGVFDPSACVTRAEVAAMIERFLKAAEPVATDPPQEDPPEEPEFDPLQLDDGVLDIAYFGDSFTYVPKIPDQFEAIAKGKHEVKTYNRAHPGWTLKDHYNKWSKRPAGEIASLTEEWDVVVLNETGNMSSLMLKEEQLSTYESAKENNMEFEFESLDDYYEFLVSNNLIYPANMYYKLMVDLLGGGKVYYNLCGSSMMKKEIGTQLWVEETSEDGFMWQILRGYDPESPENQSWTYSNYANFMWRDWLKANCNINRIMINCTTFDPDRLNDPRDFDYILERDDYHPNLMYGYCFALALYCTIYDEPCIEQNNGILLDEDIPGDTPEEKEAYMTMIKNMVQEELDFQRSH